MKLGRNTSIRCRANLKIDFVEQHLCLQDACLVLTHKLAEQTKRLDLLIAKEYPAFLTEAQLRLIAAVVSYAPITEKMYKFREREGILKMLNDCRDDAHEVMASMMGKSDGALRKSFSRKAPTASPVFSGGGKGWRAIWSLSDVARAFLTDVSAN